MHAARRESVQAVDRIVAILRCFDSERQRIGVSEVGRLTGLSTSTAHRLLRSMQVGGLVAQQSDRRYVLGPLLLRLVRSGAISTSMRDIARPTMTRLRDELDETVGLHVLLPTYERSVLDQVESTQPLRRTYTEYGVPIPLTLGAPGKAMLAHLPQSVREAVLAEPIPHATATTPTDPDVLRRQLVEVRHQQYSLSYAERTAGIRAIASGIFDGFERVVAALSVSAPALRMPPERMVQVGPVVAEAAWEISESLGATLDGLERILQEAR